MASLTIRRPVAIHAIVTEQFRQELAAELREAAEETRKRIEQLEFQARRFLANLPGADLNQTMAARQRLESEKHRLEALRDELMKQAGETVNLELGSEFRRGTLESLVEVTEGDNLFQKVAGATILIKDGVIVEIREREATSEAAAPVLAEIEEAALAAVGDEE